VSLHLASGVVEHLQAIWVCALPHRHLQQHYRCRTFLSTLSRILCDLVLLEVMCVVASAQMEAGSLL
jgi:hypothetical protein